MQGLLNATVALVAQMQSSITETVGKIFALIPDTSGPLTPRTGRMTRGMIDGIGEISSFLFGTATTSDIKELKQLIQKLERSVGTQVADSARTREGMEQYTKLQNERLDNFKRIMQEEHKTLGQVYLEVQTLASRGEREYNAIAYMSLEMTRYITLHDNLIALESGIESLMNGELTPRLVEAKVLREIASDVTRELRTKGFEPCFDHVKDLYAVNNFDVLRRGFDVFIHLRLPYASLGNRRLNVYETQIFPLPVPGTQGLITILKDIPRFLLGQPKAFALQIGELFELPQFPVLQSRFVRWHVHRQQTCLWAITTDKTDIVQQKCDFTTKRQTIESTYWEIAPGTYIISNLTGIRTKCIGESIQLMTRMCAPCIVRLNCSCQLFANTPHVALQPPKSCDNSSSKSEFRHTINLAVLHTFYDMSNVSFTGTTLLTANQLTEHHPLELPFFADSTAKLWAADDTTSYSLRKLSEGLRNQTIILHSPAEAIVHDFLSRNTLLETFQWTDWTAWLKLLPWLAVIGLFLWQITLHRRLSILTAATAIEMTSRLPRASAFALLTASLTTPSPSKPDWRDLISVLHFNDWLIVSAFLFVAVCLILLAIAVKRSLARRSYLYLDTSSDIGVLQLYYYTFPDATRNYAIKLPTRPVHLHLRSFGFFGVLLVQPKPWTLIHSVTRKRIRLPRWLLVPYWKLQTVQRFLQSPDCTWLPLVIHTHEYSYCAGQTAQPGRPQTVDAESSH